MPSVPVSRNSTCRIASCRDGDTSTLIVTAGRPFFMTIGVSHASCAPAANSRSEHVAVELGIEVVDVRLQDQLACPAASPHRPGRPCRAPPRRPRPAPRSGSPIVRFRRRSRRAPPACWAVRRTPRRARQDRGARGRDQLDRHVARVHRRAAEELHARRVPGSGMEPCSVLTMPMPVGTAEANTRSTLRATSSASAVPTMSTIESTAPTSWNVTWSTSRRCTMASASARRRKMRWAMAFASSGSSAMSSSARMLAYVRISPVGRRPHVDLRRARCRRCPPRRRRARTARREAPRALADRLEVGAGVDQRAERHVAGDAGDAIEVEEPHPARPWPRPRRRSARTMRCATCAAPNPLSMFTTATPGAHDASIVRSAREPSNDAP